MKIPGGFIVASVVVLTSAAQADTVFRHASVLPMDRNVVLSNQAVIVSNTRIVWVGPDAKAKFAKSATVIDARGKYLLPGLVDFHTHPEPSDLPSYADYGITTIAALDGEPLSWRAFHLKVPATSPNVISATRIMDGIKPAHTHNISVASPADVPTIMDPMIANGAVMAKVYSNMTRPEMEAIVAYSHERGLPVIGHVPTQLPMNYVLGGNGLDMVAHSEELTHFLKPAPTDAEEQAVVDLVARNKIVVTPNLVVIAKIEGLATNSAALLADPQSAYLPPNIYQEWLLRNNGYASNKDMPRFLAAINQQLRVQKALTHKLSDAGVLLLAGTDAPDNVWPGESFHEELALLSANGLGNYGALRAATFNAGVFASSQIRTMSAERFGVVAPGARADLLLVDGNPMGDLAALRQMEGLMIAGHWYSKAQLDAARQAEIPILKKMHADVDRYEALFTAGNFGALNAFLDSLASGTQWPFSEDITNGDARDLAGAGKRPDGIRLLQHLERLLPHSIAIRNRLGHLAQDAGDWALAKSAFEDTLGISPGNGIAKQGLVDTAVKKASH
jgi:hypothetical protein